MTTPTSIELVAAVAANGVIGRGGGLPWHLPDDLRHFKSLTMGRPILMGRRTFESIGRALPGRRSIVITSSAEHASATGVEFARTVEDGLRLASTSPGPAFVIGGATVYAAALPHARVLHLTELDDPVEGDTFFPPWDRTAWRLTGEVRRDADIQHSTGFYFRTYERLPAPPPTNG